MPTKPTIVIADITVPAEAFVFGRALRDFPDVEVELERVVPLQETILPLFWISGGDRAAIETTLREHPQIEAVSELTRLDDRTLFEVHWTLEDDELIQALIERRAKILEASGTAETWDFRLRFPSHDELSSFNVAVTGAGIPVTLRRLYTPLPPSETAPLSNEQRETLLTAYHRGYFDVPRRVTLESLAETEKLSDSALSQRIRRGLARLIEHSLLADDQIGK